MHDEFDWLGEVDPRPRGVGFYYLDHLTHNVNRGNMDKWFGFYARLFNFRQIRFFDIEGKHTGLFSRALTSPCGRIRIPINESADAHSQIEEYLRAYKGEGIQHIAVGTDAIYDATDALAANGLEFMPGPPEAYYRQSFARVAGHTEPVARMRSHGILIDGEGVVEGGATKILLQVFSKTVIGPIFFEFIQRKGDEGFGEGNFKALFEVDRSRPDRTRRAARENRGLNRSVDGHRIAALFLELCPPPSPPRCSRRLEVPMLMVTLGPAQAGPFSGPAPRGCSSEPTL